jgi:hypothetical protein
VVKWDNSTHGRTIGANGLLQDIHTGDRIGHGSLTMRCMKLRNDVETVDICEIHRGLGFHLPDGAENEAYLPYKETLMRMSMGYPA